MEFPKPYAQKRDDYRTTEAERKLYYWLRDWFVDIVKVVTSGVSTWLFGKTTPSGTDKWQFDGQIQVSDEAATPRIDLLLTRGTYESPSAVQSGDNIGALEAVGYGTSAYYTGGSIVYTTTENWTNSARGTKLVFKLTDTGTTDYKEVGYINSTGSWATGLPDLATTATKGFLYVPFTNGVPTGTPETITGRYPIVIGETSGGTKTPYYWDADGTAWTAISAGATTSTWTPTIACTTGSFTTTSTANGIYTKVGKLVTCSVKITYTDIGTATGATSFTLPFPAETNAIIRGNGWNGSTIETLLVGAFGGSSVGYVYKYNGMANFYSNGLDIYVGVTYTASS